MTRRAARAVFLVACGTAAIAVALLVSYRATHHADGGDVGLFPDTTIMATAKGPYVCRPDGLVEGVPPPPPPELNPRCHRETSAEARAETVRYRLLNSPQYRPLKSLQVCDGRMITSGEVVEMLRDHPDVRRWVGLHPRAFASLGFPKRPDTGMSCSP